MEVEPALTEEERKESIKRALSFFWSPFFKEKELHVIIITC